jgi:sugar phosphate isomerase/epimerase
MINRSISRRTFVAVSGAASLGLAAPAGKSLPVGLELYSVRDELAKDDMGTVRAVAKMGYQAVEFFAPYFNWTPEHAREMRKLMDDLGIRCHSTHNNAQNYTTEALPKAMELNQILGSRYLLLAQAPRVAGLDGWKKVAGQLTEFSDKLKPAGLRTGYHNHKAEFVSVEGMRPMEVLAANTPPEVMLQLDVGTCVEAGSDPVAWIRANPGRIRSIHCKDWAPGADKGYRVLFGEGDSPWKPIFEAAESVGGVEYYLIEQEGSRFPALETAQRCIDTWKKMRGEPSRRIGNQ